MKRYYYLHMTPEALIVSMLPPTDFGNYMAVGTKKKTRGQSVFFEIDPDKIMDLIPMDIVQKKCIPHEDGSPKNSKYLSIYNIFDKIPFEAFKSLYLTTDDGRVLELNSSEYSPDAHKSKHLYQEIVPVSPRVASSLSPPEFGKHLTHRDNLISVPRLFFVELKLGELAEDPLNGEKKDLPYSNFNHLRDCLLELSNDSTKRTKTVDRFFKGALMYRVCINGFFIAKGDNLLYYRFPSQEELEENHYSWWRSAALAGLK